MGQSIISRNNPAASGDKIGDIKFTQRELNDDWVKCDGSMVDPNVVSGKYSELCTNPLETDQFIKYGSNYERLSQPMKDLYDQQEYTNDNNIFFWDNGEQSGSGFIYTKEVSATTFEMSLNIVIEYHDNSIVDHKILSIGRSDFSKELYEQYKDTEDLWTFWIQEDIYLKSVKCNNNTLALLIRRDYDSMFQCPDFQESEDGGLHTFFIKIDLSTKSFTYSFGGAGYSLPPDVKFELYEISNNCEFAVSYVVQNEINSFEAMHAHVHSGVGNRWTDSTIINSDTITGQEYGDGVTSYNKGCIVTTENDMILFIWSKDDDKGYSFLINSTGISFYSVLNGSDHMMEDPTIIPMIDNNENSFIILNEPGMNTVVFLTPDSISQEFTVGVDPVDGDIPEWKIITSIYGNYLIYDKYMIEISTTDSGYVDKMANYTESAIQTELVGFHGQFNNAKYLYCNKQLVCPCYPNLNDENAYVKVK